MMVTKAETVAFLKRFRHGSRTNLEKGVMTNHDALAYIFFRHGHLPVREAIAMAQEWRGAKRAFTYTFNVCRTGGYGFTGPTFTSPGQWMYITEYGAGVANQQVGKIKGETYFRRHYWFRAGKGVYAPTLECFRRMTELGITQ